MSYICAVWEHPVDKKHLSCRFFNDNATHCRHDCDKSHSGTMRKKLLLVICSMVLLSAGCLRISGLPLMGALVPLLLLSRSYDSSRCSFLQMAGLTLATGCIGAIVAVASSGYIITTDIAITAAIQILLFSAIFMLYHYVSKRSRPALANVLFVCGWIAAEYIVLNNSATTPILLLGNGTACDTWVVQWYEYTGVLGGTLWILLSNLLLFQGFTTRRRRWWVYETLWLLLPAAISLVIYLREPTLTTNTTALLSQYGDSIGSVSCYIFLLSALYYIVYRFRLRSHLVDR